MSRFPSSFAKCMDDSDLLAAALAASLVVDGHATCNVVGCSRMTWNGKINEQCCRTCKSSKGAYHGSECEKRAAVCHQHPDQTADFLLYHATSLESALRIQAEGFRVPNGPSQQKAGALLGPGVYASATLQKPCSTVTDHKEVLFFNYQSTLEDAKH